MIQFITIGTNFIWQKKRPEGRFAYLVDYTKIRSSGQCRFRWYHHVHRKDDHGQLQ
jgi:hypothetical protein